MGYNPVDDPVVPVPSKNKKKKKKKQTAEPDPLVQQIAVSLDKVDLTNKSTAEEWVHVTTQTTPQSPGWELVDHREAQSETELKQKRCRALKKKLRQIEELKEKQDQGGVLSSEQQDKLSRFDALKQELAEVEASL